jgi:hypothetical protein
MSALMRLVVCAVCFLVLVVGTPFPGPSCLGPTPTWASTNQGTVETAGEDDDAPSTTGEDDDAPSTPKPFPWEIGETLNRGSRAILFPPHRGLHFWTSLTRRGGIWLSALRMELQSKND